MDARKGLKKFVWDKEKGRPKRGSLSRVAEYLGISVGWVKRFIAMEQVPSKGTAKKIEQMIAANIDLSPKPCAPVNGRKTAAFYREQNAA